MNRWLILFFFAFTFLEAKPPEKLKRYNLSICALFRNEEKYLREWIEYHRLIGVNHFFLYNNRSTDSYYRILYPYLRAGLVTLIDWPGIPGNRTNDEPFIWPLSTQVTAFENAVKLVAGRQTKWLAILDVNEFLVPTYTKTLTELLDKYDSYPGVIIASDYFDSSKDSLPKRTLLIETVEMTNPPVSPIEREVTKMIFKPNLCTTFSWPPYRCNFKDDEQPIAAKESDFTDTPPVQPKAEIKINRYVNRGLYFHGKIKPKIHLDNRLLSTQEVTEILNENYEIEDQESPIRRFIPQLKKNLGVHE